MDPEADLQSMLLELEKLDKLRQKVLWEQAIAQNRMKKQHDQNIQKV